MPNLDSVRIRNDVYRYLQQKNQAEKYIDFLLEGINVYRSYRRRESTSYMGVGWVLLDSLSHLQAATSLHRLLGYLIDHAEDIDETDSLFRHDTLYTEGFFSKFSRRIAAVYTTDASLYDKVATLYRKLTKHLAESFAEDLSLFFELTGTQEPIFWELLQSRSMWRHDKLLGKVATELIVEECFRRYKKGIITDRQVWCVIHGLNMDKRPELAERLRTVAGQVGRDSFALGLDYNAIHQQRKQHDYELLADQALFVAKVEEVFDYYQSDEVKIDKLYEYRREWTDLDNEVVIHFITRYEVEKEMVKREEVVNWLKECSNWEPYVRGKLLSRLENKHALPVPQLHLDHINQWCLDTIHRANFWDSVRQGQTEKGLTTTQRCLEWRLSEFYRLADVEFLKPVLLDMVGTELFGSQWVRKEDNPILSSKIINELSDRDALAQRLVANLRRPFQATVVWINHFELCRQLEVKESLPLLKEAIQASDRYSYYERGRLLTFYKELGGPVSQLTFIFSVFEPRSDFSWNLLGELTELLGYKRRINDFLIKRLADGQLASDDFRAIKLLISAGAIKGLQLCITLE